MAMLEELSSTLSAKRLLVAIVYIISLFSTCNCQFISHINAKGLKGNLTFDVVEGTNGSILVIESRIESDLFDEQKNNKNEDETSDSSPAPVMFDWSLHSNVLYPHMLTTCSNEDMGDGVAESLRKSLTDDRRIVLNQQNKWTIPLGDFLKSNSASSLSSLIWGKSIRLKLSNVHLERVTQTQPASVGATSPAVSGVAKPNRPSLPSITITSVSQPPPIKPTFAPRPKPQISAKLKTPSSTAPQLPKPEALVMESKDQPMVNYSTTSAPVATSTGAPKKEVNLAAINERILKAFARVSVCGNIIDTRNVKTAEAIFESQIAGKIILRGNEDDTTLIMVNLYHVRSKVTTRHDWRILASDILDHRRHEEKCKYLQVVFDPDNMDGSVCKRNDTSKCRMGDLSKKHGQIQVAGQGKNTRFTLVDQKLPLAALEGSRSLFLVIYEVSNTSNQQRSNILSCTQIRSMKARKVESNFNMDGVRGSIKFSQRHFTEPTTITYDLFGLESNIKHQTIRELPLAMRTSSDNIKLCNSLGNVFNPYKVPLEGSRKISTIDSFPVGNLSAKHGQLSVIDSDYEDHYMGDYLDLSVQLYGPHSIIGRSFVIHKNNGEPWVCATLNHIDEQVNLAIANFYYPVVGQISFRQLAHDPHSETGVLVEVFNPNSEKSSDGHNWMVHLKPAMADFYNWSQRCESAGDVYDPIQAAAGLTGDQYQRQCQTGMLNEPLRCRSGDTSFKSGYKLSLPVSQLNRSRFYYTDLFIPISGPNSIIGKSLVIYDENSPKQRGNRLACSTIKLVHPLRASVKSWNSGPSIPSAIFGSVVFEQDSATQGTRIRVDLSGFNGNVEQYAIHNVWTQEDREFPCSNDSLYDIYDPYDNENSLRLPPSAHYGSMATVDRVKVGHMSRKHGTFEGLQAIQKTYFDANAPLFAPHSIVGRSVVLRAAVNDFRWVCGTIELDYDKGESREIVGIASFDEPRSLVAGYVRFVQLEHKDGSLSDTYVQIDLRLQSDGIHDLQTSDSHNWAIFVNQVGEDAYIGADDVRCIASGFKWNPYLAQDKLETYATSCTPSEPLACAMGDLSSRHGQLTLGPNNRRTISDPNLPLVGNYSVMGRSLVIFDSKRPSVKLACANILPDIHLKSNVVIKRTPSFTVARFVEQMRSLLGAAEWLMVPELRATKSVANGECVQMTMHFYGQRAHQMQVELNNLITLGTVRKSTRVGVDKISTHFKLCRTGQMQLTSSATGRLTASSDSRRLFKTVFFTLFAMAATLL